MALDLPNTADEISTRSKTDVRRELQLSAPFVRRSYIGAIISSLSNRVFEFYDAVRDAQLESNPATAVVNLLRFAAAYKITPLPGAAAVGSVYISSESGGAGNVIPVNTNMVSGSGAIYVTQGQDVTLGDLSVSITSLTSSGLTATATTSGDHNLASNAILTISGANESGYNLSGVAINVTSKNQFTYELASSTTSPATGTITGSFTGGVLTVQATDEGKVGNLDADAELVFENAIASVESSGLVTQPGIVDGTDLETNTAVRARMLDRIQNPVTLFNRAQIRATALSVSGVTRVFVQESTPSAGRVTVYFMRDLDADPIPSSAELAIVSAKLAEIKPAHVADADLIVSSPTEVSTPFVFTSLSPNTDAMQDAIRTQLADFFARRTDIGVAVEEDAYRSAIFNTLDPLGNRVVSFTLSSPSGNLSASSGQIRTIGPVTFP